ncbi:hypothetical protein CLU79DRAFT_767366 [Phycomyces nitens]|nr:hypothetical protein CLU79DRAFT_767366 [Phycomyces nitens]
MLNAITVKWGKRHFKIEFDDYEQQLEDTTVGDLKERCHRLTGIDPGEIALSAYGAVMNNDKLPLGAYSIRPGSKVIMKVHKKPRSTQSGPIAPISSTEAATLAKLQDIQSRLSNTLIPDINAYEERVKAFVQPGDEKARKKLLDYGIYLGEQLMQILFQLDGILVEPGFETARQARKSGVKTAQTLLDRVDGIKGSIKNFS